MSSVYKARSYTATEKMHKNVECKHNNRREFVSTLFPFICILHFFHFILLPFVDCIHGAIYGAGEARVFFRLAQRGYRLPVRAINRMALLKDKRKGTDVKTGSRLPKANCLVGFLGSFLSVAFYHCSSCLSSCLSLPPPPSFYF